MVNYKVMDNAYKNDNSKNLKVHFEAAVNYTRNSSFPSSSSSSSSLSSPPSPLSPSSQRSSPESYVAEKDDVNRSMGAKQPGQVFQGPPSSPEVVSPSDQSRPWSLQSGSSAQSSQVQMMGRPAGYDPSRIPSAIFAKPAAGMDWSVASNDSLFSLHVGNNSFSRDQFSVLNINKSGELFKSGELTVADELFYISTPLPTVTEAETVEIKIHNVEKDAVESKGPNENVEKQKVESMIVNVENDSVETEAPTDESEKTELRDLLRDISKGKEPRIEEIWNSAASHRSDESNHSTKSFAFPLLAGHDLEIRSSPAMMGPAKQRSEVHRLQEMHKQEEPETPQTPETPLKPSTLSSTSWFSCFYCCTVCR